MILGIDTSSKNCSLALWQGTKLLGSFDQVSEDFLHAEILHLEIERLLANAHVVFSDLAGIVVGSGPGSYTGLRIGVAAAKGLAMALHIPLYAVSGLDMILTQRLEGHFDRVLVVMDARRHEVFASWLLTDGQLSAPEAMIVDENFAASFSGESLLVIGENASKLQSILSLQTVYFDTLPSMKQVCLHNVNIGDAVDLAYFEPTYVKPFIPTMAKK